ncbi:MAG TPA: hypothetical protein VKX28_26690 [Xanthobacteraceae bacterium]|jgi:hypothetical protein|nr:hypothetical protein [Xanthobacteraceae bacterium]
MKRTVAVAFVLALGLGSAHAAGLLTEQQARAKAIALLKGDPYGQTDAAVAKNMKQARLVQNAESQACGRKATVWEFHVVAKGDNGPIDGYLALDARSGKMVCANLPFLD